MPSKRFSKCQVIKNLLSSCACHAQFIQGSRLLQDLLDSSLNVSSQQYCIKLYIALFLLVARLSCQIFPHIHIGLHAICIFWICDSHPGSSWRGWDMESRQLSERFQNQGCKWLNYMNRLQCLTMAAGHRKDGEFSLIVAHFGSALRVFKQLCLQFL